MGVINKMTENKVGSRKHCLLTLDKYKVVDSRYHSRFFVRIGHETAYADIGNHHFFTKPCHRQTYQKSSRTSVNCQYINAIYVLALQRSLIIMVDLTMTWFSEKMMISYTCICGFMPNSHKKY